LKLHFQANAEATADYAGDFGDLVAENTGAIVVLIVEAAIPCKTHPFRDLFDLPKMRCSSHVSARSLKPNSMGTARRISVLRAVQDVGLDAEHSFEQESNTSAKV